MHDRAVDYVCISTSVMCPSMQVLFGVQTLLQDLPYAKLRGWRAG